MNLKKNAGDESPSPTYPTYRADSIVHTAITTRQASRKRNSGYAQAREEPESPTGRSKDASPSVLRTIQTSQVPQKRSKSTLNNTRLLHGIMPKVDQPVLLEIERKLLEEREIMKKRPKREGNYLYNLMDLVSGKKENIKKSETDLPSKFYLIF